jgi:hypothetical protein
MLSLQLSIASLQLSTQCVLFLPSLNTAALAQNYVAIDKCVLFLPSLNTAALAQNYVAIDIFGPQLPFFTLPICFPFFIRGILAQVNILHLF